MYGYRRKPVGLGASIAALLILLAAYFGSLAIVVTIVALIVKAIFF